ncbi:MAG: hypothetical protein ACLFV8_14415 [Alphaproteobacteria bacterium]
MCAFVFLVLTAIAVITGWLSVSLIAAWAAQAGWAVVAPTMVLAPALAILVHEAGHVLGGLAAGMRPVLMIFGPLGLHWRRGKFWPRLRLNAPVPGGFTLSLPHGGRAVRRQIIWMTAGGPASSLILAGAAAAAAVALTAESSLRGAALFTGLVSAALFLATAVPWAYRGMGSDGAKIRTLLKDNRRSRSLAANLSLLAAARAGTPPAQWPPALLDRALAAGPGTPEKAAALHFACWAALDAGDNALAEQRLDALRATASGMSEAIAAPVAFEAAAFHLFVRREPEMARTLIEGRRPAVFQDRYLEPLVGAGLALAAGERTRAAKLAKRARTELRRALFPAIAALHGRWLEEVEERLAEPRHVRPR